jgi:hypothetical protein
MRASKLKVRFYTALLIKSILQGNYQLAKHYSSVIDRETAKLEVMGRKGTILA